MLHSESLVDYAPSGYPPQASGTARAHPAPALAAAEHRWLSGFDADLRARIWQASKSLRVPRLHNVYAQGDAADGADAAMYLVLSGQLQVVSHRRPGGFDSGSAAGSEHTLTVLTPGSAFGEVGLLEGGPRPVSVRALAACELRALPRRSFMALMQEPGFAQEIARLSARKIASLVGVYNHAVSGDAEQRLARRLLLLAQDDDARGAVVAREFFLSQDMLANMLGISRQWVSKHLQTLHDSGAVELRYGRLLIADLAALQRAAG